MSGLTGAIYATLVNWIQQGAGAIWRSIASKLYESVSTKDFGVVGDGIADDTINFNRARTAAIALQKPLRIIGTPLITAQLSINNPEEWVFDGHTGANNTVAYPASYLIKASTVFGDFVTVTAGGWRTKITGGGLLGQAGNTGNGYTLQTSGITLIDPWIVAMGQDGIYDGGALAGQNWNKIIRPICVANLRHGILIDDSSGGNNANVLYIESPTCDSNGGDGVKIGLAFSTTIINIHSEFNAGYGLNFAPYSGMNVIIGGDIEQNTAGSILFDNNTNGNMVIGAAYDPQGTTPYTDLGLNNVIIGGTINVGQAFKFNYGSLNSNLLQTSAYPAISTALVEGEINSKGHTTTPDAGLLRLSAGGGSNAAQKSWIDILGYRSLGGGQAFETGLGANRAFRASAIGGDGFNTSDVPLAMPVYLVANLPAGMPAGTKAFVSNANGPIFLNAVAGGGAVFCAVFYNGAAWIVG